MKSSSGFERLGQFQARRSVAVVLLGFVLVGCAVPLVMQLGLNSAWTALLPKNKPSVQDLERLEGRIGGLATLTVAVQSPSKNVEGMQRFAKALVERLTKLEGYGIRSVDWNVASYEDFVYAHRHMYADLEDLKDIEKKLEERLDYEKYKASPLFLDLEEDEADEPPAPDKLIERFKERENKRKAKLDKYPGGYYVHPDRDLLAMFVRADLKGGDAKGGKALIRAVESVVAELDLTKYGSDLDVDFAGDIVVGGEEHEAIAEELTIATSITIGGVFVVLFVFFRRARAITLIGFGLFVPVLVTFAFAELIVDYLNTSTAFLASIVIGNGINPNIIWLARYFEERRAGLGVEEALVRTHQRTWLATLTASLAAAVAYGSLVITDFRGFRDFGIIGGIGMVLCWFGAMGILPAATALSERVRPLELESSEKKASLFGRTFWSVVSRAPKAAVAVSVVLAVASSAIVAIAIARDPIEYNFKNLKSVREGSTDAQKLNGRVGKIVPSSKRGDAIAMLVPKREDTAYVEAFLKKQRDEEGAPYDGIRTIDSLLPGDQKEKKPVLEGIRELLLDFRKYAKEEEKKKIDGELPPENIEIVDEADLPEDVARSFSERDGTRGTVLFVEKKRGVSIWDGRALVAWAGALREVRTKDGERPPIAGRPPVFADMIEVIWTDGPKAIVASFCATLVLVLLGFRRLRERVLTMLALLFGIAWMGAWMAVAGMRLNFLNFVAFPITFGNGVDYGVNVMRRYAQEPDAGIAAVRASVEDTGGAVILCSLTTIIGYSSLYTSANLALNSFGAAMAISEITCLLSAVVAMPAALLLIEQRRARAA